MSISAFCEVAVDPDTGYRPSNGLVGKIVRGDSYKVTPQLVGAIAAGLKMPREIAAAAAHLQLIGYEKKELEGGAPAEVLSRLGVKPGVLEQIVAERWRRQTGQ